MIGLLRSVDTSFEPMGRQSFRAVNRDGFMVDLIQLLPKNRMAGSARSRIGTSPEDLSAAEIEGLAWLVNCPKVSAVTIDTRGYPVGLVVPDPPVFALHKAWLAARDDRDPLKRGRDAGQARLVAGLVAARLQHLILRRSGARRDPARLAPSSRPDPAGTGRGRGFHRAGLVKAHTASATPANPAASPHSSKQARRYSVSARRMSAALAFARPDPIQASSTRVVP